jgi:hypothetical protein
VINSVSKVLNAYFLLWLATKSGGSHAGDGVFVFCGMGEGHKYV